MHVETIKIPKPINPEVILPDVESPESPPGKNPEARKTTIARTNKVEIEIFV